MAHIFWIALHFLAQMARFSENILIGEQFASASEDECRTCHHSGDAPALEKRWPQLRDGACHAALSSATLLVSATHEETEPWTTLFFADWDTLSPRATRMSNPSIAKATWKGLMQRLRRRGNEQGSFDERLSKLEGAFTLKDAEIEHLKKVAQEKDVEIERLKSRMSMLECENKIKNAQIEDLERESSEIKAHIAELTVELEDISNRFEVYKEPSLAVCRRM